MRSRSVHRLVFGGILTMATAARALSAQRQPSASGAVAAAASSAGVPRAVTALRPFGRPVLAATGGALAAGAVGFAIDQSNCKHNNRIASPAFFGPCFFEASGATATGWFGGAAAGATLAAARAARQHGCPTRAAGWRALGGAMLGMAPGVLVVARRPGHYPPSRTALVLGAPVLAGVGATMAVVRCRAP